MLSITKVLVLFKAKVKNVYKELIATGLLYTRTCLLELTHEDQPRYLGLSTIYIRLQKSNRPTLTNSSTLSNLEGSTLAIQMYLCKNDGDILNLDVLICYTRENNLPYAMVTSRTLNVALQFYTAYNGPLLCTILECSPCKCMDNFPE